MKARPDANAANLFIHSLPMPSWLYSLLAILGATLVITVAGLMLMGQQRRRLRGFLAGRDAALALSTCLAAFRDIEEKRVRQAYAWVQSLADHPDPPLQAGDRLWLDLRIDQGEIDDMMEASYEWRGERTGDEDLARNAEPITTVKELMAQVLGYGFEGYAEVELRGVHQDAP